MASGRGGEGLRGRRRAGWPYARLERQLAGLAGGFMRMRGESGGSGGWLRTRQERCGDGDAGGAAEASPGPQAQAGRAVRTWGRSSGQGLGRGGGVESDRS